MWEVLKRVPRGRVSLRSIPLLATGLFVAVLVCLGASKPAYADDVYRTTDGGFTYQGTVFTNVVTIQPGDSRGLATAATGEVTAYENINDAKTKAAYLYFAKGVDPKTATTALYTTFDYTPPSTYSNQSPSPPQSLTISTNEPVASSENAGGCTIPGLGWILCPVGDFLSTGVDWIYKIVMMFLDVQPMLQNGPIYDVWSAIRSLANIVFVIVFLIVIFSQITSVGISTYGIRKILPRLVIAALLVNMSFIISAVAIDLSNVLGHAVYAFVHSFYESLGNSVAVELSWSDIATTVLAGGGTVGGAVALHLWFSAATAGSVGAVFFMLLGVLISVGLAALTALIILFARQGLLIIFTLISPFAFVAMVLPSTEKWFKKWQETFTTLLLMFPIFSFVFSGALLAGAAIIAGSGGNILLVILGKTVQVLPLAITPLLIKLSSGLLGTVAQFTNNKNKGMVDRAKNWTNSQAEHARKRSLGDKNPLIRSSRTDRLGRAINRIGKMGPRGTAQMFDSIERRQKREQEGFEEAAQARAFSTVKYRRSDIQAHRMNQWRDTVTAGNDRAWEKYSTDTDGIERTLKLEQSRNRLEEQKGVTKAIISEAKTGQMPTSMHSTTANQALIKELQATNDRIALNVERNSMAERKIISNRADLLSADTAEGEAARRYAAGVMGEIGERSVKATAKTNASKFLMDDIKNIESTLDYDVSSNVNKLYDYYKNAKTDAERVAYTSIMGKRGAPGAVKLRQIMNDMDARHAAGEIDQSGLNDFKELVLAQNPSIGGVGKDIEFYLTNAAYGDDYADPALAGKTKTYAQIANETTTWSNLSADAFSRMNIVNQMQGLKVLAHKNPDKFNSLVSAVMRSPSSRANLKDSVLEAMLKHANPDDDYWYSDPEGYNTPKFDELSDFERHAVQDPEKGIGEFSERSGYDDKDAAYWKAKYDAERTKTASYMSEAEQRARNHGKTFY